MKSPIVVVCAWAALAVSTPSVLQAQTPAAQGKGQQPSGTPQGGKPAGTQGGQGQGATPAGTGQKPGTQVPGGQTPGAQVPGAAQGGQTHPAPGQSNGLTLRPGDDIVGMNLDQRAGKQLGRINDLVIRPDGSIGYVVLETPGAGGAGSHYPIPWSQMQYEAQPMDGTGILQTGDAKTGGKGRMMAGFDADRLKGAPAFDGTRWPKDTTPFDESERYYGNGTSGARGTPRDAATGSGSADGGVGTTPAAAPNEARFRASQFKEQVVVDAAGEPIGKTGRLAIDPAQGRVNYVTIVLSNVAGASGRTIAVPWSALRSTRVGEDTKLQLNLTGDKLKNAPQFKGGSADWTEMSDPNWVRSLYGYYGVDPYWSSTSTDGTQNPPGTRDTNTNGAGTNGGKTGEPGPR